MLFAGKRNARSGAVISVAAVLGVAAFAGGASAQDTCPYKDCSTTNPTPTPGSGTLPVSVKSGRASLGATRTCTKTSFPVSISGRSMRRVTIYVNGRLAKRITVKSTATRVTTKLPTPVATSKITVKVTFATTSGTKPKSFSRTVKRCVPAAVSPSFTG
jgi:hypothetical protein